MRSPRDLFPDEHDRLVALHALGLLDTPREASYDRIVRLVARHFAVPYAALALVDRDRVWLKAAQGFGASEYTRDGSLCAQVLLQEGLLQVSGAAAARYSENEVVAAVAPLRFFAACTLQTTEGQRAGTLWIADKAPRTLDGGQQQALRDFAAVVDDKLAVLQRAAHDELTGMANRRGFLLLARQNLAFCMRQGCSASLVLLDVAGLKAINDTYGCAEGDLALLALADLLGKAFRGTDSVARLGGDRFAVFLANVKAMQAALLFNRVAALVERYNRQASRGYELAYSSSITEFSVSRHSSLEQLLEEAESSLYRIKNTRLPTEPLAAVQPLQ